MGRDIRRWAETSRQTDERVIAAVAEMMEAGEVVSPLEISRRYDLPRTSTYESFARLGIEWKVKSFEAAGEDGKAPPPTPEQIRDGAASIRASRHDGDIVDLAEALTALVAAKKGGRATYLDQKVRRLRHARHRLLCAIGGVG